MRASAFLYPWDVTDDPQAARTVAATGVDQVTLASAYHSTRALTPRHPRRRVVTARHSAVYYPPDPARWQDRSPRPYKQSWISGTDTFGEAARALAAEGLPVHAWVILAHNSRLGEECEGRASVRNAYGDSYPWALCIAQGWVREYLVDLAAEAAVRPEASGVELESCGWYGLAHLHAHDKIAGVPLGGPAQYLMSLCFCRPCRKGYEAEGADPLELRDAVIKALEPLWTGEPGPTAADRAGEWAGVQELLGGELAAVTLAHRGAVARSFQREVVRAVRAAAAEAGKENFRVMLHADPALHRCGANVGVDAADVLQEADGLVLPCGDATETAAILDAAAEARRPGSILAANFTVVRGMGGRPAELFELARHAAAHGADELRLYHAGLASNEDLAHVEQALRTLKG